VLVDGEKSKLRILHQARQAGDVVFRQWPSKSGKPRREMDLAHDIDVQPLGKIEVGVMVRVDEIAARFDEQIE
jgi:hypothetical protein